MKHYIHPDIIWWENLNTLPSWMLFIFDRLLLCCDDWGRLTGSAERIKAKIFPLNDEITPEVVEAALKRLETLPAKDLRSTLYRYDVGDQTVLQINTVLWESWNGSALSRRRPTQYPDDPKYSMTVETETEFTTAKEGSRVSYIANLHVMAQEVTDYWNVALKRTPKASWTSQRLQEMIATRITPRRAFFRDRAGCGWTQQMILRAAFNLDEVCRDGAVKPHFLNITFEDFLDKHADYFLNPKDAADYALKRKLTVPEERFRERLKTLQ